MTEKQFECDECDRAFDKRQGLAMHRRVSHPRPYVEPVLTSVELEAGQALDISDDVLAEVKMADVVAISPPDDAEVAILVDPETGLGGIPWNPERAAARARAAALAAQSAAMVDPFAGATRTKTELAKETLRAVDPIGASLEELEKRIAAYPNPSASAPVSSRRKLAQIQHRCHEGYPEGMDAKWLLAKVELADSLLQVLAQPHVLERWEQALGE